VFCHTRGLIYKHIVCIKTSRNDAASHADVGDLELQMFLESVRTSTGSHTLTNKVIKMKVNVLLIKLRPAYLYQLPVASSTVR